MEQGVDTIAAEITANLMQDLKDAQEKTIALQQLLAYFWRVLPYCSPNIFQVSFG